MSDWSKYTWGWVTSTDTTWDTCTGNSIASIGGVVAAKPAPKPKRTALDWLDERVDEMREMGRELLAP